MCENCNTDICSCNPILVERGPAGPVGPVGPKGDPGDDGTTPDIYSLSTTSVAVGTGSRTFTVDAGMALSAGMFVTVAYTSSPTTTYMWGVVSSYSGTTLVVSVAVTAGTGTHANWEISLAGVAGPVGLSLVWQGSLASAPGSPALNWGYYDTTQKKSFIWDGSSWNIIAVDGLNGTNGTNGANGIGISWKGDLAAAPGTPSLNWAYRNTVTKISYIWNGSSWDILCVDGTNGTNGTDGFNYETVDGNKTPAQGIGNKYSTLMRNETDAGYTFVSVGQYKATINAIPFLSTAG
jgi:hypothetical protein